MKPKHVADMYVNKWHSCHLWSLCIHLPRINTY